MPAERRYYSLFLARTPLFVSLFLEPGILYEEASSKSNRVLGTFPNLSEVHYFEALKGLRVSLRCRP